MLKYGPIIYSNNLTSNRNLSRKSSINFGSGTSTSTSSSSGSGTDSITIDEIYTKSISTINDSQNPYIIFSGDVAFTLNKNDNNNFDLYPILFTRDIKINNKLLKIESDKVKIKTNILNLNSELYDSNYVD